MTTVTVTTTGAGSFTILSGVTSIEFEAWGGGDDGSTAGGNSQEAGGGGGAYIKVTYTVTPGDIIYYSVATNGSTGSSWFNKNSNAGGGVGAGAYSAGNGNGTSGGSTNSIAGGQKGTIDLQFNGGAGAAAQSGGGSRGGSGGGGSAGPLGAGIAGLNTGGSNATGKAGGAGNNGSGGAGGAGSGDNGTANVEGGGGGAGGNGGGGTGGNGGAPGGGGGGGGSSSGVSGTGARGQIRYTYTVSTPSLTIQNANSAGAADNIALTQHNVLAIQGANSASQAGNVVLSPNYDLVIQNANSAGAADNVVLSPNVDLVVSDANSASQARGSGVGPELLTNLGFDDATNWTLTTATISGGVLHIPTGSGSSAIQTLGQTFPQGSTFNYSIDRQQGGTGSSNTVLRFKDGALNRDGVGINGTSVTTLSGSLTLTQGQANSFGVTANGSGGTEGLFDNVSLKEAEVINLTQHNALSINNAVSAGSADNVSLGGTVALTVADATSKARTGGIVSGPNLLTNPTFDSNITGWGTADTDGTFSWQSGKLRIARNGATTDYAATYQLLQSVTVFEDNPYEMRVDFSQPGTLTPILYDGYATDATITRGSGASGTLVRDPATITGGSGSDYILFGLDQNSGSAGQYIEFDNVIFRRVNILSLTQHNALAIANANSASQADNLSLTQHTPLAINTAMSAGILSNITLTQHNVLAIANSNSAGQASNITLTQHNVLAAANANSASQAGNVTLSTQVALTIAAAVSPTLLSNVTLLFKLTTPSRRVLSITMRSRTKNLAFASRRISPLIDDADERQVNVPM